MSVPALSSSFIFFSSSTSYKPDALVLSSLATLLRERHSARSPLLPHHPPLSFVTMPLELAKLLVPVFYLHLHLKPVHKI